MTRPATDYVRRFVAKVPPARVIKVGSLMQTGLEPASAVSVGIGATIAEVTAHIVATSGAITVTDAKGQTVGQLDRQKALETLSAKV